MIREHERGTEIEEFKTGKTRWEVCTGEPFFGIKYPLGALVFYRAKSDGMAAPTTRPGLFAGWRVDSGLRYRNVIQIVDYEAVRARAHLICIGVPRTFMRRRCFSLLLSMLSFLCPMQR